MRKTDNSVLTALAFLEAVKVHLKVGERKQISRAGLELIRKSLTKATAEISKSELSDIYILGSLISVVDCISNLLENDNYLETDVETKEIVSSKVLESLDSLYLRAGKYYETHDFDYNVKLNPRLKRIVDRCIESGYYFGY